MRLRSYAFSLTLNHSRRFRILLPVQRQGVHNDHGAARIVADAVRYVAEQEGLSPSHAGITHYQNIDGFTLSGTNDRQRGILVNNNESMPSLSGKLPHDMCQVIFGGSRLCVFSSAKFRGTWMVRHDHLHHE